MIPTHKTYVFDLPYKTQFIFGKVMARNKRAACALVRLIFKMRALPAKSKVWAL